MGNYLLSGLRQLQSRFPVIHEVRGLGLMDAISVETDDLRNRVIRKAFQKGLLVASCGFESIRFLPPLNVTQREIDIALNILEDVFSEVVA
jgi:4-aminobutyrate aminotransferase